MKANILIILTVLLSISSAQGIDSSKIYCADHFAKLSIRTSSVPRHEYSEAILDLLVTHVYRNDAYLVTEESIKTRQRIANMTEPEEYLDSIVDVLPLSKEDMYRYGNFVRIFQKIDPNSRLFQDYIREKSLNEVEVRNFMAGVRRVQEHREDLYALEQTIQLSQKTDRPYYSPRFVRFGDRIVDIINNPYDYGTLSPNFREATEIYEKFLVRYIDPFKQPHISAVIDMEVDIWFNHRGEGYFPKRFLEDLIPIVEAFTGQPVLRYNQ